MTNNKTKATFKRYVYYILYFSFREISNNLIIWIEALTVLISSRK